ncbi:hypothetical protein [Helicobacter felis]|uniref:hypothetical protein n=1 Tax=Helicobacter felis TaxID=214 RepID=UPI000CF18E99|nr:hypothetical protein [Helicobacter felis]
MDTSKQSSQTHKHSPAGQTSQVSLRTPPLVGVVSLHIIHPKGTHTRRLASMPLQGAKRLRAKEQPMTQKEQELLLLKLEHVKGISRLKESAGVLLENECTEQALELLKMQECIA